MKHPINKEKMKFEAAKSEHQDIILNWLNQPHVMEFWDNSQAHKDDIVNFIEGRKTPSNYFDGCFNYWVGCIKDEPYCLLMTSKITAEDDIPDKWKAHLAKSGTTLTIDFCIGNTTYLGKGLAAPTLQAFCKYIKDSEQSDVNRFFIDPDESNPRAIHVYAKAGFKPVDEFEMEQGYFKGQKSILMIKQL